MAGQGKIFLPAKEKVDTPWHDVPFALHVPFEVPFEGGTVNVFLGANFSWEKPEVDYTRVQHNANGTDERLHSYLELPLAA